MPDCLLLVDDDPALVQLLGRMLGDMGRIRFATSGDAALRQVEKERPDLILMDAEMPGMSGFEACAAIKALDDFEDVPVIFVTAHLETEFEVRGFAVGAADFIHKPVSAPILRSRVATHLRLKHLSDELKRLALTDALTQLPNRRSFDAALEREWARALRERRPLCGLMIDIDCFKQYNDLYGHPTGDRCLHGVAQALQGALMRASDLVARYGGEEFAALLPNTNLDGGRLVAQRMLQSVLALRTPHERGVIHGIVSISIGVAHLDDAESGGASLMALADQALYRAKEQGRAGIGIAQGPLLAGAGTGLGAVVGPPGHAGAG